MAKNSTKIFPSWIKLGYIISWYIARFLINNLEIVWTVPWFEGIHPWRNMIDHQKKPPLILSGWWFETVFIYTPIFVFFFWGGHLESWRVDLPPVDLSALENSHYNRHITIATKTTARKSSNTRRTRAKRDQPEKEREEKQTIVSEKSRCSCIR